MNHIAEVIATLKERRKNKKHAGSAVRVNELFEKLYHYSPTISIPIPNLYAHSLIEKEFDGMEQIDFDNDEHLGRLLFILRNQDSDIPEQMTAEEKARQVRDILREIGLQDKEKYQQALYEMFIALKKNSIRRQKTILTETLEILRN